MRKLVLAAAALLFVAAGCSDDKPSSNATDTTAVKGVGEASLKPKLLAAADLPDGFRTLEGLGFGLLDETGTTGCAQLDGAAGGPAAAQDAGIGFLQGNLAATFLAVEESVLEYLDAATAQRAYDAAVAGYTACKTFSGTDEDGAATSGELVPRDFPTKADGTFAAHTKFAVVVEGDRTNLDGDLIVVRSGRFVAEVSTLATGTGALSAAELESIVGKAAAKL